MAQNQSGRIHALDIARGLACLSMPIYHGVYYLKILGLTTTQWTKHWFWEIYQNLGLSTFLMVSGMAFVLSTRKGIRWKRLLRRLLILGGVAGAITLVTFLAMESRFVRFGIIHFYCAALLLAVLLHPLKKWLLVPGLAILTLGILTPYEGINPNPWLYITGLMSQRPSSMDYIPLTPWFGVFLIGMGLAHWFRVPDDFKPVSRTLQPVAWLGRHSLAFYILHLPVVYGLLLLVKRFIA